MEYREFIRMITEAATVPELDGIVEAIKESDLPDFDKEELIYIAGAFIERYDL